LYVIVEVAISEARARLAELAGRVEYGGEEFLLSRHGRPVARLVPAATPAAVRGVAGPGLAQRLARAGRTLWVANIHRFARLGLFPGQEQILLLLWERDGRSQDELRRALGVEPATASKMLRRMEAAGLVARERAAAGRGWSVRLTDRGRALREPVEAALAEAEARLQAALSPAEAALLGDILDRISPSL
jgi:prevent-host-death family protein